MELATGTRKTDLPSPFLSSLLSQEGSFAFGFKSVHFPAEIVLARRGSPLLIGVKTDKKLKVDFVDVEIAADSDKPDLGQFERARFPSPALL